VIGVTRVARNERISAQIADENSFSLTDDFSVSSSRDEKISANGMVCRAEPTVWSLVGVILDY